VAGIVCPVPAVDVEALKFTVSPTVGLGGPNVKVAVGAVVPPPVLDTETGCEVVPTCPISSVTVRVTVYTPFTANLCVADTPVPAGAPSPQLQSYEDSVWPVPGVELEALKKMS